MLLFMAADVCVCVYSTGKVGEEECAVVYPPNGEPSHSRVILYFKGAFCRFGEDILIRFSYAKTN